MEKEIELLKLRIKELELMLEIEKIKEKMPSTIVPYIPYYPNNPIPLSPIVYCTSTCGGNKI